MTNPIPTTGIPTFTPLLLKSAIKALEATASESSSTPAFDTGQYKTDVSFRARTTFNQGAPSFRNNTEPLPWAVLGLLALLDATPQRRRALLDRAAAISRDATQMASMESGDFGALRERFDESWKVMAVKTRSSVQGRTTVKNYSVDLIGLPVLDFVPAPAE